MNHNRVFIGGYTSRIRISLLGHQLGLNLSLTRNWALISLTQDEGFKLLQIRRWFGS